MEIKLFLAVKLNFQLKDNNKPESSGLLLNAPCVHPKAQHDT